MTCVEISELNGRVGNSDHFAKSRQAEAHILTSVSRLIQRPIQPNLTGGVNHFDFHTSKGGLGDIKIYSKPVMSVELQQNRQGRQVAGWFYEYLKQTEFVGLFTVNPWFSEFHQAQVFKLRWIPWAHLINWVIMHAEQIKTNRNGEYMLVDPTHVPHVYVGDFFAHKSVHGDAHAAFDTSRLYANNKLNIKQLYEWF
jgi:hypothetical protein